ATWWGIAGLLGLVVALYWPVRGFEFVNWDDPWYVLNNPLITSWHPSNLWRIATEMSVKNYAPLTTLSLLIDQTLFGFEAGGYHVTNVLLHALNAVLVYVLVSRLTGNGPIGLATAALFAVHPVQIESVAWVSSRKTLLCSTFMLASAVCWLREDRSGKQEMWGILWLLLALLSKAAAIVVPPIVLAFDVLVRRKSLAESLPRQLIPGLLCVLLLNVTMSAQTTEMGGVRGHLALSKTQILAIDAVIVWKYVGMLLWPAELNVLYDPPTQGISFSVFRALAAWGLVAWACWRRRHTAPLAVWAVITWFLLLFPVLNLFPITTLMNDRYLYLPSVCAFGLVAGVVVHGARLFGAPRLVASVSAAGVLLAVALYGSMTASRLPVWRDDFSLWNHTISRTPQIPVVQIQWADALHTRGETANACDVLRTLLEDNVADEGDRERVRRRLDEWEP
ncbi:MAG: glycosyltransferase family 39 protein, partial [Planctomycetaceae bacterium]|nr:glycosyltransferase family 39 protein [Planctomycetaceae bacterium]